jgi:hypothetical protein
MPTAQYTIEVKELGPKCDPEENNKQWQAYLEHLKDNM